jgi:hypothetical protein
MKRLNTELKRILSALALQHAGDYLPMREKLSALGGSDASPRQAERPVVVTSSAQPKRVALISDGRGAGAPLDYAIDTCMQQGAQIDLLLHGEIEQSRINELEEQLRQAGVISRTLPLGSDVTTGILEYICNHPSLLFLVGIPDDTSVRVLVEEVIPHHGGQIPVPLVLIEDRRPEVSYQRSAA